MTIRSRTVLMKIPKLSYDEVRNALVKKFDCSTESAHNAALLSNGNWIQANNYIDNQDDEKVYFSCFQKWMRYCFKFNAPELIDFIANDIKPLGREKQKEFLSYGLNMFHNALFINNGLINNVLLPDDEKNFLRNFAPFISNNNIDLITELFEESINQIERNGNAHLIFLDDSFKIFNYFKMK
jgi:DNA polymerase-3 subunit delta'